MKKISYLLYFTILLSVSISAQTVPSKRILLQSPQSGTNNVVAQQSVTLKNGFKATGSTTSTFNAKIDEALSFGAEYLPTAVTTDSASRPFDTTVPVNLTQGSVNVSPTGAATYHFPINIPAGIAGMEPSISIDYNSQGGDGPLGIGWNISGLSAITRVPKTIFTDGVAGGIHFDANDRFALDGNRLLPLSGSTYETEIQSFTKIEAIGGDSNGPSSFKVTTKDGKILFYGNSDDSKVIPIANPNITPAQTVLPIAWRLKRVEEPNGNFLMFTYKTLNGESVIEKIDYNGNSQNSPSNSILFFYDFKGTANTSFISGATIANNFLLRKVKVVIAGTTLRTYNFDYTNQEGKSNLNKISEFGANNSEVNATIINWGADNNNLTVKDLNVTFPTTNDKSVFSGDVDGDGISDLITRDQGSNNYLIWNAVVGTGGAVSFPVSTVAAGPKTYNTKLSPLSFNYNHGGLIIGNIDGDNKQDILLPFLRLVGYNEEPNKSDLDIYVLRGDNFVLLRTIPLDLSVTSMPNLSVNDMNNDGLDDFIILTSSISGNVNCEIDYVQSPSMTSIYSSSVSVPLVARPQSLLVSDFDGDGLQDIMVADNKGYCLLKNSAINVVNANMSCVWDVKPYVSLTNGEISSIQSGDFNGDGLHDLVLSLQTSVLVGINRGDLKFTLSTAINGVSQRKENCVIGQTKRYVANILVADYNYDGLSDLIVESMLYNSLTRGYWTDKNGCYGMMDPTLYPIDYDYKPDGSVVPIYADLATVVYHQPYEQYVGSRNEWYKGNKNGDLFEKSSSSIVLTSSNKNTCLGDFDGDGRQDIINYGSNIYSGTTNVKDNKIRLYNSFNTNFSSGLVTSISDGLKNLTSLTYQPITITKRSDSSVGSDFYTKGTSSVYPIVDISAPFYCVSSVAVPNGVGGISTTEYSYSEARVHQTGKGFLGFSKQTAVNKTSDKKMISSTLIDLATVLPSTQNIEVQTASGTPLSSAVNTFEISKIVNGTNNTYRTYLRESKSVDKLTNVTTTTTNMYDNTQNLTQSVVNVGGTNVQTTVYSGYVAVNGSAYVSKPTSITITSKHPDDPNSFISKMEYTYDSKGNVLTETKNPGAKQVKTEYIGYDSWGMPKTVKTTSGSFNVTQTNTFSYTNGVVTTTTSNANLGNTKIVKDLINRTTSSTGTNGLTSTTTYDGLGHEIQTVLADNNQIKTKIAFDFNDDNKMALYSVFTETDGRPWVKTYYDLFGRSVQTETVGVNGLAIKSITLYNKQGKIEKQSSYVGGELKSEVTYSYKPNDGRLQSEKYNNGRSLTYAYSGLEVKTTDNNNNVTTTIYNSLGNVKKVIDPSAASIEYSYASCGKQSSINIASVITSMTYDELGNQKSLNDPNAGNQTYEYDGLGRLVSQTDAENVKTTLTYNSFGQLESKVSPTLNLTYTYYTDGVSRGQLKDISNSSGIVESFEYDNKYGRPEKSSRKIADLPELVVYKNSYDNRGNVSSITYPGNYVVTQTHDKYGNLIKVSDSNTAIWTLETQDAKTFSYTLGNDFVTTKTFDNFGKLTSITSVKGSDYYAQNNIYEYFTENDLLKSRSDERYKLKERFTYDNLERLRTWKTYENETLKAEYSMGYINNKISSKSDIGSYDYKIPGKPHAISSVALTSIPGFTPTYTDSHTISYNENGKVSSIVQGTNTIELTYGYDDQREKTILTENGVTTTTYFAGSYEVKKMADGTKKEFLYIPGGDGVAAVLIKTNGSAGELFYLHKDNLGSITALTDNVGVIREQMSYDAWGRRRNYFDWSFNNGSTQIIPSILTRGYTGHEHFDAFALINMNGRIYDPLLGSFISCDNYIQNLTSSQNFNRYSYCLGNPLKYTDPTGQKFKLPKFGGKHWIPVVGQLIYLMDVINDNTVELRENMTNAGIPDFNAGYNTSMGGFHSIGDNGNYYWSSPDPAGNAINAINDARGANAYQQNLATGYDYDDRLLNRSLSRPDLGYVGNEIRDRAGSDFSKDMFENYWLAKGDVHLTRSRFNDIVSHTGAGGKPKNVTLSNGQPGVARVHSFYGDSNPYALVLGRATIYYQGGSPVGFQDGYDFNWRWMWGEGSRTVPNELKTRAVSTAGFFYGAEPFNIYYGIRP